MPYGTNVARSHFAGENLIGRVLITEMAQQQAQVVGVVGDIRGEHLTTPSEPDPTHAYGTSVATRHLPQRLHDEGLVRVQCTGMNVRSDFTARVARSIWMPASRTLRNQQSD